MLIPLPVLIALAAVWCFIWIVLLYRFTAAEGMFVPEGLFLTAWAGLNFVVGGVAGLIWLISWFGQ